MGKRGPPPEPTVISMLKGNPSKKAIRDDEPQPGLLDDFTAPEHVAEDEMALRKWTEAVPVLRGMRVLTEADIEPLARYCLVWSSWMAAREQCRRYGLYNIYTEVDPNYTDGRLRIKWSQPHAWTVEEKAARKDLLQLEREFGLTPASRTQVSIHSNAQDDPLAAFVRKRSDRAGA